MRREDLYNVDLKVIPSEGNAFTLRCDKLTGGDSTGKDLKYRPGNGLENQLSLGGPRVVANATLTRLYDPTVDPYIHVLINQAGKAAVVVTKQPLDENGHAFGTALIYTGKLMDVKPPPTDSEADKAALIEFVCSLESTVG